MAYYKQFWNHRQPAAPKATIEMEIESDGGANDADNVGIAEAAVVRVEGDWNEDNDVDEAGSQVGIAGKWLPREL